MTCICPRCGLAHEEGHEGPARPEPLGVVAKIVAAVLMVVLVAWAAVPYASELWGAYR